MNSRVDGDFGAVDFTFTAIRYTVRRAFTRI